MSRVTEADVLPFLGRNAHFEDGFVVTGAGTAWRLNEYLTQRRYITKPEVKARKYESYLRWVARNRDHRNAYMREWMRQYRARQRVA